MCEAEEAGSHRTPVSLESFQVMKDQKTGCRFTTSWGLNISSTRAELFLKSVDETQAPPDGAQPITEA